jgi:hypothetical protein
VRVGKLRLYLTKRVRSTTKRSLDGNEFAARIPDRVRNKTLGEIWRHSIKLFDMSSGSCLICRRSDEGGDSGFEFVPRCVLLFQHAGNGSLPRGIGR